MVSVLRIEDKTVQIPLNPMVRKFLTNTKKRQYWSHKNPNSERIRIIKGGKKTNYAHKVDLDKEGL